MPDNHDGDKSNTPTRVEHWVRVVVEALLAAGIAWLIFGAESRISQDLSENQIKAGQDRQAAELDFELSNRWMPLFIDGDDFTTAERMIVTLDPVNSAKRFMALRQSLNAAGLMTPELEQRIEAAIQGAERAQEFAPRIETVISVRETEEDAGSDREFLERLSIEADVREADGKHEVVAINLDASLSIENLQALLPEQTETTDEPIVDATPELDVESAEVPDVYRATETAGIRQLREAGFEFITVWRVTSSSVEPGRIREVVLNNGEVVETEIVDETGVLVPNLPSNTRLAVKVVAS